MNKRFERIIIHYKKWKIANPDRWVLHCCTQTNVDDAIMKAAISLDANGKKHPHQYRLQNSTLQSFGTSICQHKQAILAATNFDDIYTIVENARIHGIGDLAIYDAAVRIAAFLNIHPEQIYLHAGARVGAEALLGKINSTKISKTTLPVEFSASDLGCYELEDLLCIYKKMFLHARGQ